MRHRDRQEGVAAPRLPEGFEIEGPLLGQSAICEPILRGLPDWFGLEHAIVEYVEAIDTLPTFLVHGSDGVVGFVSVKQHSPFAAELYVLGILADYHRHGVGRAMIDRAERWMTEQGIELAQVKTLGPLRECEHYGRTRAFYLALGYRPLEETTKLWGEDYPCLILVKPLRA